MMLVEWYLWVKAFHVMAVISWMAGLFYLPRLFVYHVERTGGPEPQASFEIMEEKLLRVIMNPAMVASWILGVLLVLTPGVFDVASVWVWTKLFGISGMTWFHIWLARERKRLKRGDVRRSGRQYRIMNEIPTILMLVIVLSVVLKF